MKELDPISIEAVVEFNKGEAYVFNRLPLFKYEKSGRDLIAKDGPFADVYRYEAPLGRFKAFAGRKFDIPLADGGVESADGQYWSAGLSGFEAITYQTVEGLQRCYVYYGGLVEPDAMASLRSAYTGCVYPYRDYEKIIRFDHDREKLWRKIDKIKRDKASLVKHVKQAHETIRALSQATS